MVKKSFIGEREYDIFYIAKGVLHAKKRLHQ